MDDLARAQAELARTLGRARAGEDRALGQRVRDGGDQLATVLSGLLKLSRVHAPDNRALDAPVAEATRSLAALVDLLGTVHVVTVEDQVYVNDVRIRMEGRPGNRDLGADLRRHGLGGLSFHAPLTDPAIRTLIGILARAPAPHSPRAAVAAALAQEG